MHFGVFSPPECADSRAGRIHWLQCQLWILLLFLWHAELALNHAGLSLLCAPSLGSLPLGFFLWIVCSHEKMRKPLPDSGSDTHVPTLMVEHSTSYCVLSFRRGRGRDHSAINRLICFPGNSVPPSRSEPLPVDGELEGLVAWNDGGHSPKCSDYHRHHWCLRTPVLTNYSLRLEDLSLIAITREYIVAW